MAHFAELDENNTVLRVVVVDNRDTSDKSGVEREHIGCAHLEKILGGVWRQTSYNSTFRKNYAGVGYTYNSQLDAFIPPRPYTSWILDTEKAVWKAPVDYPSDTSTDYEWNEDIQNWQAISDNLIT